MEDPVCFSLKTLFYLFKGGFTGKVIRGLQYWDNDSWDQDQLWRFTLAMARWIDQCEESESKASVASWEVSNNCAEMSNRRIGSLARKQVRSNRIFPLTYQKF